ncbi:hypothetical protein FQN54_002904 [Arachnomyces sp. PD_36]|nr:hypothetical protein FQN54_002904 [Arachnomyces sp. PD_36]
MAPKRILVIAGSDSSGGAGIEADQRVLAVHQCYALTATTGLTAQNTLGVTGIHVVPPEFVRKQIETAVGDVSVEGVKVGMLSSKETVEVVVDVLKKFGIGMVVIDPVMVSTSGSQLLPEDAVQSVREKLLPMTTLLTPNMPEAKLLLHDAGIKVNDPKNLDDVIQLAKEIQKLGPKNVLLKGGHLPLTAERNIPTRPEDASIVVDVLCNGSDVTLFESDLIQSKNTHGTGCSLASAITANLVNGMDVVRATQAARWFVEAGIKTSFDIGSGNGPINHFHSVYSLPFAPGRFIDYLLERPDVSAVWERFTRHKFVAGLGDGTLPLEKFKGYLIQDYLYLIHFARSNALAAYKNKTMEGISASSQIVLHIERETALHLDYCASFGLSRGEIEKHEESQACTAYSRYILDVGQSEDWLALQVALAPCLIGYGAIAKRLHNDESSVQDGNRYWKWIENYVADDYSEAVRKGSGRISRLGGPRELSSITKTDYAVEILEKNVRNVSRHRMEQLVEIFIRATVLEIWFWDDWM